MTAIHLVSSGKGNVGKSGFASVLNCVGFVAGADPQLVDADDQKQTLSNLHGKTTSRITISDDPALENQPDAIWYVSEKKKRDVIVDLAAESDIHINKWLEQRGVIETAKAQKTQIIKWWVSDLDPGSLSEVVALSSKYPPTDITHVLVKSYYRDRAELWDAAIASNSELSDAIATNLKVIEFPRLFGRLMSDFRRDQKTFKDIILDKDHKKTDMLNRSTVLNWIEACTEQIGTVYKFKKVSVKRKKATEPAPTEETVQQKAS